MVLTWIAAFAGRLPVSRKLTCWWAARFTSTHRVWHALLRTNGPWPRLGAAASAPGSAVRAAWKDLAAGREDIHAQRQDPGRKQQLHPGCEADTDQ
jgi:hypothetical protein